MIHIANIRRQLLAMRGIGMGSWHVDSLILRIYCVIKEEEDTVLKGGHSNVLIRTCEDGLLYYLSPTSCDAVYN